MKFLHQNARRRQRRNRHLTQAFGASGMAAALCQFLVLPADMLFFSVFAMGLSLVFTLVFKIKNDHLKSTVKIIDGATARPLYRRVAEQKDFRTRSLRDEGEVRAVSELEDRLYNEENVELSVLYDWFRENRNGVLGLFTRNEKLVGAIGFWPLKEAAFRQLRRGEIGENQIRSEDIVSARDESDCPCWYLSSLSAEPDCINRGYVLLLLFDVGYRMLRMYEERPDLRIQIVSLAYSQNGARLLERFGFNVVRDGRESRHGHDVYLRTFESSEDVRLMLENLGVEQEGSRAPEQRGTAMGGT